MSIEDTVKRMFPVDADDLARAVASLQADLPLTSKQAIAVRRALMSYEATAQAHESRVARLREALAEAAESLRCAAEGAPLASARLAHEQARAAIAE